jgi:hypothetical protein
MKTKKTILSLAINVVVIAAFAAVCFLVRKEYTTSFYFSFGAAVFSFLTYVLSTRIIPKKKEFVILGYSPVIISSIYFFVTAGLNFLFILFKMENLTVNLVFNIIITAAYLVLFFFNLLGNENIKEDVIAHKAELAAHYNIKDAIMPLKGKGGNLKLDKKLEALCDAASSAQIYRNGGRVALIDEEIVGKTNLLKDALNDPTTSEDEIVEQIEAIKRQITERNTIIQQSLR